MSERHHSKVLIIGAGPAGYTAAIYAARANLHPILVTGLQPGGQLTITTDVENYPGFAEVIQGPWLMEQMQQQAEHVGTKVILDMITEIDLARRPFVAKGDSGDFYVGETVILATGAQARWLGIPSEEVFRGFGVSACATCDGFFFRGKDVVVVGGGNLSDEPRAAGHSDPSPRRAQSRKDPAGEAVPQSEDRHHLGQRRRGNPGSARTAYGDRGAPAQHAHRQSVRPPLRRGLCRDRPYTGNRVRGGPAPT